MAMSEHLAPTLWSPFYGEEQFVRCLATEPRPSAGTTTPWALFCCKEHYLRCSATKPRPSAATPIDTSMPPLKGAQVRMVMSEHHAAFLWSEFYRKEQFLRCGATEPRSSAGTTTPAELFYLRHLRSSAAAAVGNKSTASGPLGCLCTSVVQMLFGYIIETLQAAINVLVTLSDQVFCRVSPLEIAACLCLYDTYKIVVAVPVLALAMMDWHVPNTLRHSDWICRYLSAMAMQALHGGTCWILLAALYPTFGKQGMGRRTKETTAAAESDASAVHDGGPESLADIVTRFAPLQGHDADIDILLSAVTVLTDVASRNRLLSVRALCNTWGVKRTEMKTTGKRVDRHLTDIESELQSKVLQRARELCTNTLGTAGAQQGASASVSTATERLGTAWALTDAKAACLQCFAAASPNVRFSARLVDHASSGPHCISGQIALMLQTAGVHTIAEFSNTQVVDACAYIAADAIARLREAALAQENGWLDVVMPDYTRTDCVRQGNAVLEADASTDARVLESDDVNRLVRHYSYLDTRVHAAEEWWGGAVALDNFTSGLMHFVESVAHAE